ncbi:MAG: hypothetical protein ACK5QX_00080, partial [bacterium]
MNHWHQLLGLAQQQRGAPIDPTEMPSRLLGGPSPNPAISRSYHAVRLRLAQRLLDRGQHQAQGHGL